MKCDLFLLNEYKGSDLGPLHIFDKGFVYRPEKKYSGFLGLNVDRIKMVSIVVELRRKRLEVFSSDVRYRDLKNISAEEAARLAYGYAAAKGINLEFDYFWSMKNPPVFWGFRIVCGDADRTGGIVMIDRLDGHVWNDSEYAEYLYDYNNIL